jgi:hypothetical protein
MLDLWWVCDGLIKLRRKLEEINEITSLNNIRQHSSFKRLQGHRWESPKFNVE